jgi:hypothetical protein
MVAIISRQTRALKGAPASIMQRAIICRSSAFELIVLIDCLPAVIALACSTGTNPQAARFIPTATNIFRRVI